MELRQIYSMQRSIYLGSAVFLYNTYIFANLLFWCFKRVDIDFVLYDALLPVQVIERHKKHTIVDILSQVGGTMGLWMGASIMTVIHFSIMLLYNLLFH